MGNGTGHLNTGQHAHVRACTQTGRTARIFWPTGTLQQPHPLRGQDGMEKKTGAFVPRRRAFVVVVILSAGVWKRGLRGPEPDPGPGLSPGASRQLHSRAENPPPFPHSLGRSQSQRAPLGSRAPSFSRLRFTSRSKPVRWRQTCEGRVLLPVLLV